MNDPRLKKVGNGYLVLPARFMENEITRDEDIMVFETWEGLVNYLKKTLDQKKKKEG